MIDTRSGKETTIQVSPGLLGPLFRLILVVFLANKCGGIWLLSTPVHSSFVNNGGHPSWLRSKAGQETFIDLLTLKYATNHGVFYIFYYSMYLLKICVVYFSKDLFQKEKKCEIFDTGRILTVFQGSQTRD